VLAGCTPSVEDEQALGDQFATQVESQLTLSTNEVLDAYVDSLAGALTRAVGAGDRKWKFSVVESPEMNAFAIPGGHIYVHTGMLSRVQTMPELAGVLAHEIGHVVLRHSTEQMTKRTRANVVVSLFCSLTGWCEGTAAQAAINVGGAAFFARHSRTDESEADSVAVGYLVAAGIDPEGVPALFERIAEEQSRQPDLFSAFFSSHPVDVDRVARTSQIVRSLPDAKRQSLRTSDSSFARMRAALPISE
jgi:predicted Zn-dependent protease